MKWIKRILVALVVIFAVFYLVTRPEAAAGAVRTALDGVVSVFDSIVTFFTALAG